MKTAIKAGIVLAILFVVVYLGFWKWLVCRVYVDPGETLMITSKFGADNPNPDQNRVVDQGTKGVWREVFGEGRYFFNPIEYKVETRRDVMYEIPPGKVGVMKSNSGKPLPEGKYLAPEGFQGIVERPLTAGKWRLNPFENTVEVVDTTMIRPGYVGVVTRLEGENPPEGQLAERGQRGIQKNVIQPGIYYLNPRQYKVDEIGVGYSEITLENVAFPSRDGFTVQLDITVVWGLIPKHVPTIINRFGNTEAVIQKIIRPQIESICRIEGSKYGAKDFIEGTSREQFQRAFTDQLFREAQERNIEVLIGLVRDIDVPIEVRQPIQNSKIAAEEQITKEEQRKTQQLENELEELKAEVSKGVREVGAETEKMVAGARATGERKVATVKAEREVAVAEILRKVAELAAERERILGKAEADVIELLQKAEADRFQKNVGALGDPEAYANYIFATKLPDDLKIFLRYAGPGTFWTDLPAGMKSLEDAAARKLLEREQKNEGK